ncbi:MAG TPA: TIM44-like domain-containing protein [Azospirillum sp.]|nr:TIM44-like domain-containing protein [Azospirillum sp.]
MTHDTRTRRTRAITAVAVALAVALSAGVADARAGKSSSSGSRGARTYDAPATTNTAPGTAAPMERTMAQPGATRPSAPTAAPAAAPSRGFFGGGFMSGLMGGLIGAGIGAMLFGGGFFDGLGSFAGILGFILQIVLVVFLVRLAMRFFRNRSAGARPAYAGPAEPLRREGVPPGAGPLGGMMGGLGGGAAAARRRQPDELGIGPADYSEFERLLVAVQTAYSSEDQAALRTLATPEMQSYFAEELAQNTSRGVINKVSDVRLLQGDLSEAWREGNTEYATVAMRFGLVDVTVDRATGRVVEGDPNRPTEATEVWTFTRPSGGRWILSAIQQTR